MSGVGLRNRVGRVAGQEMKVAVVRSLSFVLLCRFAHTLTCPFGTHLGGLNQHGTATLLLDSVLNRRGAVLDGDDPLDDNLGPVCATAGQLA